MKYSKIIDISIPIHTKMLLYPGDPKVKIEKIQGKTSQISVITMGSHAGTHIDVPRHAIRGGKALDRINLEKMIGSCRIIDMTHVKDAITVSDLKKHNIKKGERILVKTKNSKTRFKKFNKNYIYLDGDAADYLAKIKIALFGIDYLSVKQKGSHDLRPHTSLLKKDIVILETIDLSKVKPGKYFLSALPLNFQKLDGSPVRAILLK